MVRNNRGEVPTKAVDKTFKGMVNSIFYSTSINKVECGILFVVSYKRDIWTMRSLTKERKMVERS